ncbi:hypothetical protein GCM10010421_55120 [Streptomyces glaucus]|uniref:Secreted protein n=1 Tax=Streptomyces glaucus TaxID=284029 RepID=A0ABN3KBR6_9ACTN
MSAPARVAGWGRGCMGADMGASAVVEWSVRPPLTASPRNYGRPGVPPIRCPTHSTLTLAP